MNQEHGGAQPLDAMERATTLLAPLRTLAPQSATAESVATLQYIGQLLSPWRGSPIWIEVQGMLASHLLECPQGDRSSNVSAAEAAYRAVLDVVDRATAFDEWVAAAAGLANALMSHPAATPATLSEAHGLFERVIDVLRHIDRPQDLASVLANYANLLGRQQFGDIDAATERAIVLQSEVVALRAQLADHEGRDRRARAHHNLAALLLRRRGGLRSDNVDRAIRELRAALADRPAVLDAVGRVRTLRALAVAYPEWSGAASRAHAQQLADEASAEAEAIESDDAIAGLRREGWVAIARQQSALRVDLDFLQTMPPVERRAWLRAQVDRHVSILQQLGEAAPPSLQAEWLGGCARLMGRLPNAGQWDFVTTAHELYLRAVKAAHAASQPRIALIILRCWGEFAHEVGHFEESLSAYGRAADLGAVLFDDFGAPEHQRNELETMRGDAQFAAYAGIRSGRLHDALRFAEMARNRMLADALLAARIAAEAGDEDRAALLAALQHVQQTEAELRRVRQESPQQQFEDMRSRLAEALGADTHSLHFRRTDDRAHEPDPTAAEQERLLQQLLVARTGLRDLLIRLGGRPHDRAATLEGDAITTIATAIGVALVYVMATVHGVAAVAALPDGRVETLLLDQIDSQTTRQLADRMLSADAGAMASEDVSAARLEAALESIAHAVRKPLFEPVNRWLRGLGVLRVRLVPLGSTGVLPWQLNHAEDTVFAGAPSVSALSLAAVAIARPRIAGALVLADPHRDDVAPLPFARAEGRWIAQLFRDRGLPVHVHVGAEATLDRIQRLDGPISHVHLACHGHHRTSDPLDSALLLAGNDALQLADLLAARSVLGQARLATLSACRSGEVENRRLPDEALGFPVALLLAGVSAVIGTRWAVSDAAAMLFTATLYPLLLDGVPADDAVAQSRHWLRHAPPEELAALCARIRATLADDDHAADAALSDLWRQLLAIDPQERPFAALRHWAAFTLDGA